MPNSKDKEVQVQLSVIDTERKYSVPEYSESIYSTNSIVSYGAENDLPILLRNCYRGSATLKSIIDGMVMYILGDDIIVNPKIANFAKSVNDNGMSMRQYVAAVALDLLVFGGYATQVILSKMGTKHALYPLDFGKARTNEPGSKIWYSKKNWTKYGVKSTEYPRFSPDDRQPASIYYYKGDFTRNVYPLPTWYGALADVLTEMECSKYSLNSVSNGFSAKYILNLPNAGNLTKEQKNVINKEIREKFTGTETDSNFMLYFANGDKELTVSKVESDDATDRFIAVKDNCRSNIYTSMRCSPLLMGLPAQNGFSTSEYRDCFKIFQRTVVSPLQDSIIEGLDYIFQNELAGEHAIEIIPFSIQFDTNE